jgi:hypothetical protein
MEKLFFVCLPIVAALAVVLWRPALTIVRTGCARLRSERINRHLQSQEMVAAMAYWYNSVMRDWEQTKPLTESQLYKFATSVAELLAIEYLDRGDYPDIGVFYYAPHTYGVHPLLVKAAQAAGMPSGAILQASLPNVQMRISTDEIAIKRLCAENWIVAWRQGDGYSRQIKQGEYDRPRRAVA